MLSYRGVLYRKHLQLGVIKGAIEQGVADERYTQWVEEKNAKIESKRTGLGVAKDEARKQQLAAETKVREARAEALRQKQAAALAANAPAAEAEATEGAEAPAENAEEAGA
jgi:small subunit ribosomal protein S16